MLKVSETVKRMVFVIGIASLVFIAAGAVYYRSLLVFPFILGIFLGSAVSTYKVIMLEKTVEKAVEMDVNDAGKYIVVQKFIRFTATGAVLLGAALIPFIELWGAVLGILTMQISVLYAKYFLSRNSEESINTNKKDEDKLNG